MHQLPPGKPYSELREHWVIFIVDRDIFGLGLPLYRVERFVLGERDDELIRLFGDGAHILFVNGGKRDGDTPLSRLLHDIFCPDPAKMYYDELREALGRHKTPDGGSEMMRETYSEWEQRHREMCRAEYLAQGREEGREEGIAIGKEQGIAIGKEQGKRLAALGLLKGGFTLEQVAQYMELPLEEVRALDEQRKKRPQPDDPA